MNAHEEVLQTMTDLLAVSDAQRAEAFGHLTQTQMDVEAHEKEVGHLFHALLCAVHVLSDEAAYQRERADRFEAFAAGVEGRHALQGARSHENRLDALDSDVRFLMAQVLSLTEQVEKLAARPALVEDWQGC